LDGGPKEYLFIQSNAMHSLNFSQIQRLAFAGGGNRCWWQAGLVTHGWLWQRVLSIE
jgi:hypothetical protein